MDFALEEHQEQLVRSAQQWIERSWARGEISSSTGRRSLWDEIAANGWERMLEADSAAATVLDAALLVERLALGGCSLPLVGSGLIAPLITEAAEIGVGDRNLGLLASEAGSEKPPTGRGLDIADTVIAVRWTLDRELRRWEVATVPLGDAADLLAMQTEDRFVLCRLSDPDTLRSATWQVVSSSLMDHIWRVGAVLSAAELVGLARAVLDRCVQYAGIRVQGGKPIGGHQAVQHRLADMLACIDRSRYLMYAAATGVADDAIVVHQAKALAARDCLTAIRSAHQVMGAISFSAEDELHHFHKQALLAANEFGSANHHWNALEQQRPS